MDHPDPPYTIRPGAPAPDAVLVPDGYTLVRLDPYGRPLDHRGQAMIPAPAYSNPPTDVHRSGPLAAVQDMPTGRLALLAALGITGVVTLLIVGFLILAIVVGVIALATVAVVAVAAINASGNVAATAASVVGSVAAAAVTAGKGAQQHVTVTVPERRRLFGRR